MRWEALFGDLEAQAQALDREELDAEVRDRVRRETALIGLADRLAPSVGRPLQLHVAGAGLLLATLVDAGPDWLLLAEAEDREVLVPLRSLLAVAGVRPGAQAPALGGDVGRRLDLRWALRGLARDRAGVGAVLRDGTALAGTLDRVGADHVELAEHAAGEPRRAATVRGVRLLPLDALGLLRRL